MAKVMTLSGATGLGDTKPKQCKCIRGKGGRSVKLCNVGKSKKHRSGWAFVKGGC
jgi:hypothetical protein